MGYCDWCNKESESFREYYSLGTGSSYDLCSECYDLIQSGVCRECGELIDTKDIAGLCYDCAQDKSVERLRKVTEAAEGVNYELIAELTKDIKFTEEDYDHWMTLSQRSFSKEERTKYRKAWLRAKLLKSPNWTIERIEANMSNLEELIDRHSSNILRPRYAIVYLQQKADAALRQRVPARSIIDMSGDVILIRLNDGDDD